MRIGTKILLLMLLITIGSSAIVAWIVTLNVTSYETQRADAQISHAIARYLRHLDDQHQQVSRIVRALLEAPTQRSLLQAAGDAANVGAREQLRQEVFGRDVQSELQSREGSPAFHVLLNLAHEVVLVSSADPQMAGILSSDKIHWPVDAVLTGKSRPIIQYIATPVGLFLAMGVPLRTQLDEAPDNAYFVGFRIDDNWARQQLLAEQATTESTIAPLAAWFFVDDSIVARASSDASDTHLAAFKVDTPIRSVEHAGPTTTRAADPIEFDVQNERFLGQSFNLKADNAKSSRLILASSLDRALLPLRRLQRQIIITAVIACLIAIVACRFIARIISRPIGELVAGTRRIAEGHFDSPVHIRRRDELGTLANSFNEMA